MGLVGARDLVASPPPPRLGTDERRGARVKGSRFEHWRAKMDLGGPERQARGTLAAVFGMNREIPITHVTTHPRARSRARDRMWLVRPEEKRGRRGRRPPGRDSKQD